MYHSFNFGGRMKIFWMTPLFFLMSVQANAELFDCSKIGGGMIALNQNSNRSYDVSVVNWGKASNDYYDGKLLVREVDQRYVLDLSHTPFNAVIFLDETSVHDIYTFNTLPQWSTVAEYPIFTENTQTCEQVGEALHL